MKLFIRFLPVLITVLIAGHSAAYTYTGNKCVECHKNPEFKTLNNTLFDYYTRWKDSIHDIAGVSCHDCHGGDPKQADKNKAHSSGFLKLSSGADSSFKDIPARCGRCHKEVLSFFKESKHYRVLIEKGTGPHCSTCHGSVNSDVYYASVIAMACKDCHNKKTGNHPETVIEADKILHRINVAYALKRWVLMDFTDILKEEVEETLELYDNVADSWHRFDFKKLDKKSDELLRKIKSVVSRGLEERKKGRE